MSSTVEHLGPKDVQALRTFLARDPVHNLYLLGLLEEFGVVPAPDRAHFAFYANIVNGEMIAAVFVGGDGGLVVPSSSEAAEIGPIGEKLADKVKLKACVGDKVAVDELMRHLCPHRPQFSRTQRLFAVSADDLGPFTNPTLRLANVKEVPALMELASGAIRETFERDPMAEDPEGFRARVVQRVRGKRTYVLESEGRLVFKIDVGSRSQYGAELEGLYTIPDERRKGHATLSLGQISRHLLSSLPRLTLRVDDRDPSLAGVARKVGYVAGKAQRVVVDA